MASLTSAPPSFSAEDLPMAESVPTTDVAEHILSLEDILMWFEPENAWGCK
jgi:hypothetical protein